MIIKILEFVSRKISNNPNSNKTTCFKVDFSIIMPCVFILDYKWKFCYYSIFIY